MSKHTPGPWGYTMRGNYMRLYMPCSLDGDVARGYVGEANARLIAAAPELLDACMELMDEAEMGGSSPAEWDAIRARARAAIAKATGGDE